MSEEDFLQVFKKLKQYTSVCPTTFRSSMITFVLVNPNCHSQSYVFLLSLVLSKLFLPIGVIFVGGIQKKKDILMNAKKVY